MAHCRICSAPVDPFMVFERMPQANGFLAPDQLDREWSNDLPVAFCRQCLMCQLADTPAPAKLFNANYAYFTGMSRGMTAHFARFAKVVRGQSLTGPRPFVVEMGSNDGTMLANFADIDHLGIEPSANVAEVAVARGLSVMVDFFNEATADRVVAEKGQADAMIAANVMAHIANFHSVAAGIKLLLKPTGLAYIEAVSLADVVAKTAYDQLYDEHVYTFSVLGLGNALARHDLVIVDVEAVPTHGGSLRYVIGHVGARSAATVAAQEARERAVGLDKAETFADFRRAAEDSRDRLVALLRGLKAEGKRIAGYGATAKSTLVLNWAGLGPDVIDYIQDNTPAKQGKLTPGTHIPVEPPERFRSNPPDYAVLFAWNHSDEIMIKEPAFTQAGGRWIIYVPEVRVI